MFPRLLFAVAGMALFLAPSDAWASPSNQEAAEAVATAKGLANKKQYEEAIDAYTEAIRADPHNTDAILARASLYDQLELPALADEDYDLAVKTAPDSADAWRKRAYNHQAKRRFAEALRDLDATVRLDPASHEYYRERALIHELLGQKDLAVADYTRVIELDPDKADKRTDDIHPQRAATYFNRALMQTVRKHYEEAVADFEQSEKDGLAVQPEHGDCLAELGRWKEAREVYDRIVHDDQRNHAFGFVRMPSTNGSPPASNPVGNEDAPEYVVLYRRALACLYLKDFDGAEADLEAAIKMRPQDPRAYGVAAWVRAVTGPLDAAREAALKGLSLDRTQIWIRINLADVYLLEGRFDWARSIYLADHGKPEDGSKTRAQRALGDFEKFRQAGVTDPNLARMEELLRQSVVPSPPPSPTPGASPAIPQD